MRRSALLNSLSVATPCDVPWSSMAGNDQIRFCGRCHKNVYNISNMTRDEALDTIERTEGRMCLQLSRRPDGTIATADCWVWLRRARGRGLLPWVALLPVALALQLGAMVIGIVALKTFIGRPPPPVSAPPNPNAALEAKVLEEAKRAAIDGARGPWHTAGIPPHRDIEKIRIELRRQRAERKQTR